MGTTNKPVRRALWDAINEYTESCGGHGGRISTRRMEAVVAVEQAVDAEVAALRARVAELEQELEREVHAPALPDDYEVKRAEHDSAMWRLYYRGNWAAEVCEGAAFMYGHLPVAALRALFDAAERGGRSDDNPEVGGEGEGQATQAKRDIFKELNEGFDELAAQRQRQDMSLERIAIDVLRCALAHERDSRLVGNVTAHEIAALAASIIDTCPSCGCCAWTNLDCHLCCVCSALPEDGDETTMEPEITISYRRFRHNDNTAGVHKAYFYNGKLFARVIRAEPDREVSMLLPVYDFLTLEEIGVAL